MSTVLVTGATGLLGAGVARRLTSAGRKVVGLDNRLRSPEADAYPFFVADINDVHGMYAAANVAPVDAIVHCGGVSGAMLLRDKPFLICETNVRGTAQVLEIARVRKVRRLVFCSSIMAYGNVPADRLSEDTPLMPGNVYGASKAAAEAIILGYHREHGVDGVALRISHVYGPRRRTECFVRQIIEDSFARRTTRLPQSSRSRRQFVYVDDVVESILLALDAPALPQPAYNIAADEDHSLGQLAEVAGSVLDHVQVEFDETKNPPEYQIGKLDISAARRDLGYHPSMRLKDGISAYAEWLRRPAAAHRGGKDDG